MITYLPHRRQSHQPSSTLKDNLLFWYDIANSGTEDLTDQHGVSADLNKEGTPSITDNYAVVNGDSSSPDRYSIDSLTIDDLVPDPLTDDGSFIAALRPIDLAHGDFVIDETLGRLGVRFLSARWDVVAMNVTESTDTDNPSNGTDYVIGLTWTGGDPNGTVEKWVSASGGNMTSIGTASGAGTSPTKDVRMGGNSVGTATFRLYWVAGWTRKLTDSEMQDALLEDVATTYSDL